MSSIIKVDQIQSDTGNVSISGNVSSTLRVSNTSFPLIVRAGSTNHITMFDTRSSTGVGTMIGSNEDGNTYYDSNYNATATAGGHIFRSGGSNIASLNSSGLLTLNSGQLKFPASQNASADPNTLDDYEEGSWTPFIGGNATYTSRTGRYIKVGNLVWIYGEITINVQGTGQSSYISGLPFANGGSGSWEATIPVDKSQSLSTSITWMALRVSGTDLYAVTRTAASTSGNINAAFIANGTTVQFAGCYSV